MIRKTKEHELELSGRCTGRSSSDGRKGLGRSSATAVHGR